MEQPWKYEAIVIGTSWGGLEAISKLCGGLPATFPVPIIVVQHRLKYFHSELEYVLQKKVTLKVHEIEEKEELKGGTIYLAPADYHVLIEEDHTLSLCTSEPENYSRPSIDVTFESAADIYKDKLIGIVLTGANTDGSKGLKTIANKGGLTIVQNPTEAELDIMPKSALEAVPNSYVFTLSKIKDFLLSIVTERQ